MNYQVINEELRIASCGIGDLTMKQVTHFLDQWESGAKIGRLTLFYDEESGYVVLNRDNEDYRALLELAEKYLSLNRECRLELWAGSPASMRETLDILDRSITLNSAKEQISRAKKNSIEDDDRIVLNKIMQTHDYTPAVMTAFLYGEMRGKQKERTRRKQNR